MRRFISCVLLVSYLSACTKWEIQGVSPQLAAVTEEHDKLWVARTDSAVVILEHPRVTGDTLSGLVNGTEVSIRLVDVAQVGVKRFDGGKTLLMTAVVGMAIMGALLVSTEGLEDIDWGRD
jgi:hypothetical protein